ncbi:cyanophycin synthetase [Clostridium polyendosporum]|uniref:Cyanophycin synthetase n=1 Tax=Clostridium polyendosporum TaxID=69208 RepID=A0A919S1M1_9CLOT|nr:cyanophycin synthetase [Clostridium polyendosporum]GIM29651.1 cyanophycin synthetase [Clostridium polyendosporum]
MKLIKEKVYEGRNIYSHKKCLRIDIDLEGYSEIPTKDIPNFNFNLTKLLPELYKHRCGIDEEGGFVKRLEEGTYLAHVCEHTIIAIQNIMGIEVSYGKARVVEGEHYFVVVQYEHKKVALGAVYLVIDLINSLINQKPINFEERVSYLRKTLVEETTGPSTKAICDAAKRRKLPIIKLGESGIYQIGYGKCGRTFGATIGDGTRCIGADISCDKLLTKRLLEYQYIPVAPGEKVFNTINLLQTAEKIGYPVVLKPQFGNKGKGVILNIKSEKELLKVYKVLSDNYKDIIIEKYIKGNDYRICVVNHEVIAVAKRMPPYLIGDGEHNIVDLIKILNSDPRRGESHEKPLTKIKIDENLLECLNKQGVDISSVPLIGEKVLLRENANLSTGGSAIDCTDEICEENRELCIRASKVLGLDICGIDICTEDISKPIYNSGVVVEINAAPGIRMHHFPSEGKSRDVAGSIVDMMYNNNPRNIPVISITGTNGKTTTARLAGYILSLIGYNVGITTTEGIIVGNKYLDYGDDTGPDSARTVLLNRDVDVAVLETARGGIVRSGLGYDLADIGVITNITEDHLGIDEIESMEDLSFVKSLVVEAIKEDGYAVINADDEWSLKILNRVKARKIFFSIKDDNVYLRKSINEGNPGIYIKDNALFVENNNKKYYICAVNEIAITKSGKLKYNVYNAMACCAALVGIGVDYCIISKGLKQFQGDENYNPGRFNEYDINGIKVILDYGHNIDGYKSVLEALKDIPHKNLIGIIGVPGDRSDSSIERIGSICGEAFDYIYIKEDIDSRGRKSGEVAQIILKGINKTVNMKRGVYLVLDELQALKTALTRAKTGDVIIVFFEQFQNLVEYIKQKQYEIFDMKELMEN